MTDDLRTRIAAVITDGIVAGDGHGKVADAVIAELGLTEERDRPYSTRTGWAGDWRHRYVTEWTTDE